MQDKKITELTVKEFSQMIADAVIEGLDIALGPPIQQPVTAHELDASFLPDADLEQRLFGAHLLLKHPDAPVCIVESEKTAVICAGYVPNAVWLATGGKNGARWTEPDVIAELEGRDVTLYPDLGAFDEWSEKAKILGTVCDYKVSDFLEREASDEQRAEGGDIADWLIAGYDPEYYGISESFQENQTQD